MKEALLNKAKEALRIQEVYLRHTNAFIKFDLDPEDLNDYILENDYETARSTNSIRVEEIDQEGETLWEYHFYFFCGVRKVDTNDIEDPLEGAERQRQEFDKTFFSISATFDAVYQSKEVLEEDVLEEFAKANVAYHVWPFWREHVHSTCSKMNLLKVEVPHYMCTSYRDESVS